MEFEYNIIESHFTVDRETVDKIKTGSYDSLLDLFDKEFFDEKYRNILDTYRDFGDAELVMRRDYTSDVAWIKEDIYACSICWIAEDDGYNGGEFVEGIHEFNVYDKPEMTKEDIIEQLKSIKEDSLTHIEADPFVEEDVWRKDIVAVEEMVKLLDNPAIKISIDTSILYKDLSFDDNIKNTYHKIFKTDDMWKDINDNVTFEDAFRNLKYHNINSNEPDFYTFLGVCDSLVRERVFEMLVSILNAKGESVKYDDIYNMWCNNSEPKKVR